MSKLRLCLLTTVTVLVSPMLAAPAYAQGPVPALPASPADASPAALGDPIADPIPGDPVVSDLALQIQEFASFPKSEPTPPPTDARLVRWARINYIGSVPDGSGRLYVPDLNGKLYLVENGVPHVYLDVGATFAPQFFSGRGLGQGFGFVAFHPDFRRNGKFYTVHTELASLATRQPDLVQQDGTIYHGIVTEWTATDPSADVFSGTRREVLRIGFGGQIHGIQQIDFNPTARPGSPDYGKLYLAVGEGGLGVRTTDPQNLAMPHGKVLRIDPLGTNSANGRYGIPADNPFVGRPGVLGEIYAYGFRDPHRFSWDTGTGRLFLGHIGEHAIEMVDDVRPGDNFGWSDREGPFVFNRTPDNPCDRLFPLPPDDAANGYTYPVVMFDHNPRPDWNCTTDVGHAISGGFVYRGKAIPALQGKYLFADLVDGRLFYTQEREMVRGARPATIHELKLVGPDGQPTTFPQLVGDPRVDLRYGTDSAGELYLIAKANGKIWKITGLTRIPSKDVLPGLQPHLVASYDFEHPVSHNATREQDQGSSGTPIDLVNGWDAMRVADGAFPGSTMSVQTGQRNPTTQGNDDWKAGTYQVNGAATLHPFNAVHGITIMGWVKMTGDNPSLNTTTPDPNDFYNAIGLAGLLSGDSEGHAVRALLEIINVNGELRLVALGRRIDGGASQTFAANAPWQTLLPRDQWVFLAATFDYDTGQMALYRNGAPVPGFYVTPGDPWGVATPGPHPTSATDPRGIKIGGSFPQNTQERNPCNCRFDSLMFLDAAESQFMISEQYRFVTARRP